MQPLLQLHAESHRGKVNCAAFAQPDNILVIVTTADGTVNVRLNRSDLETLLSHYQDAPGTHDTPTVGQTPYGVKFATLGDYRLLCWADNNEEQQTNIGTTTDPLWRSCTEIPNRILKPLRAALA